MTEPDSRVRRRALLDVLTALAERGALLPSERPLMRALIEAERRDADQAASEQQLDAANERADRAETELRVLRAGLRANGADPTQIQNLWAQIRLRNRQWRDEKQRAAEAELKLSESESLGHRLLQRAEKAEQQLAQHQPDRAEQHRLALSKALGLGTGAPWDAIKERVAEQHTINRQWADWLTAIRQTVGAGSFAEAPERVQQLVKAEYRADHWKAKAAEMEADRDRADKALADANRNANTYRDRLTDTVKQRNEAEKRVAAVRDAARRHGPTLTADEIEHAIEAAVPTPGGKPATPKPCPPGCIACATDESHDPQPPAEQRPVTLGTPCANCDHVRNFHPSGGPCTVDRIISRGKCPCAHFEAAR